MAQTAFFVQYVLHTARWIESAVSAQFEILSIYLDFHDFNFYNPMILMTHLKLWFVLPSKFDVFDTDPCLCSGIHPVHTREICPQQLSKISAVHKGVRQGKKAQKRIVRCHVGVTNNVQKLPHLKHLTEVIKAQMQEQFQSSLFSAESLLFGSRPPSQTSQNCELGLMNVVKFATYGVSGSPN